MTRRTHSLFLAIAGLLIMAGFLVCAPIAVWTSPMHLLGVLGGLWIFAMAGADLFSQHNGG